MNSDDIMSDPAHPMNSSEPRSTQATSVGWNTKKFRDEYEMYKNRLHDQKFSVGKSSQIFAVYLVMSQALNHTADYPDPLSPRPPHPKQYPKGTTPELERKLQALIAKAKAGAGNGVRAG
jgi:hypothetical protein